MAESANIIAAVVQQWNNSSALKTIPLRSTRIPQGTGTGSIFPYCLVENRVVRRFFHSGDYKRTVYLVTLTLWVGQSKATLATLDDAMVALFDRNVGLPVNDKCYVLEVQLADDDPELDAKDYYGQDVNSLRQTYKVVLSETINPINKVLAT